MTKARSSRRRLTRWSIFRSRRLEAGRRHAAGLQPHERDAEKRSRHPQAPPSDPSVQGTLGSLLLLSSNLVPRSNSLAISYYVKPEPPILFKFLERHLAAAALWCWIHQFPFEHWSRKPGQESTWMRDWLCYWNGLNIGAPQMQLERNDGIYLIGQTLECLGGSYSTWLWNSWLHIPIGAFLFHSSNFLWKIYSMVQRLVSQRICSLFFWTQSELNEPVSGSSGGSSFLMFLSQPPR